MTRRRTAFSLLELLAVVTILGIIAVVVIRRIMFSIPTTKETSCFRNKAEVNRIIEKYYFEKGVWPADMTVLAAEPDFPDGAPTCPVTGAPYTFDAVTHRITGHTAGSH